eukprot:g41124.t1
MITERLCIVEARCQLSDTTSYRLLDYDPTPDHQNIISQAIHNHITSGDLPPTASNLIELGGVELGYYLLPKIQKSDSPGRPIVSANSCPTELISIYFDCIYSPLVQKLPTY